MELKEWEDRIKSNKTKILYIIVLVKKKTPQKYKEDVISFIDFVFGEGIIITDWLENINLHVSNIEE